MTESNQGVFCKVVHHGHHRIFTSNRGRPIVIREGHFYNIERETDIKTFWRCNFFYKTKWKCRLQTIGSTVLKNLGLHLAEPENAEKQKAYVELKKRAGICKSQPPGSLIATFSMELEEHVLAKFPAMEHTKKAIYNQSRKELPPLPNDIKSFHTPNELQIIKFGEQELPMVVADTGAENGDQRIIVFAIQPHLEYLKNCETLICDGTFDALPLLTYQLYTIHSLVGDIAPPLLFAKLPNKNTLCYDKLLELVKKVCPEISPKLILTDFEKAARV